MRSPKDMRIIQIDITNACVNKCSNCTRFCGHHEKNFFMGWETFKKSIDSLEDFERCVGIMGGEPTLHPQFKRFVEYAVKIHGSRYKIEPMKKPVLNFQQYMRDRNYFLDEALNNRYGIGLFSSVCKQYYKHFELIQDSFSYQLLNDHQNPSLHQPLLVSRVELGISDEEWIPMRDNCWIQNMWSASITPKGAFFCEVAAALDMLLDGPGGWPIEKGWWKREPKDFGYQLNWCEICGGALFHSGRLSSEEIDDISPMFYDKLKKINSPKLRNGDVEVIDMNSPQSREKMPDSINRYLPDFNERISKANRMLFPETIDAVIFCENDDINLDNILSLKNSFDIIILFAINDKLTQKLNKMIDKEENIKVIDQHLNSFGRTLNKAINATNRDWICYVDGISSINEDLIKRLKNVILNPGVLYSIPWKDSAKIFNLNAEALRKACYDGISNCNSQDDFYALWEDNKKIELDEGFDSYRNPDVEDWIIIKDNSLIEDKSTIYKALNKIKSDYEI